MRGATNSFQRIQKLSEKDDWEKNGMTAQLIVIQIYVSLFVGGVLAIVLYGIFASGFIQCPLFPEIGHYITPSEIKPKKFSTFKDFAVYT